MSEATSSTRVFLLISVHLLVGVAFATSGLFLSPTTYLALWGAWGLVALIGAAVRRERYVVHSLITADLVILAMAFLVLPGATR